MVIHSPVYDPRCYELWRRERNVYFLTWRGMAYCPLFADYVSCSSSNFFPVRCTWPCFILNFCFTHLLLLLNIYSTFITIPSSQLFSCNY